MSPISTRRLRLSALALGTLLAGAVLAVGALDPAPAAAIPNPFTEAKDFVGGVLGAPAKAVSGAGAAAFKEVLEFLIGDLHAVITLATIKFLTRVYLLFGPTRFHV